MKSEIRKSKQSNMYDYSNSITSKKSDLVRILQICPKWCSRSSDKPPIFAGLLLELL